MAMRFDGSLHLPASLAAALMAAPWVQADEAADLAKQLANPIASLISVPLQYNTDTYGGFNDGATSDRLVIQPVIPFALNEDWNLITRTIVPLVEQRGFPVHEDTVSGLAFCPSMELTPGKPDKILRLT
ncbi:hypothetical protein [Thiococcus pfennigii]|uniref:hypothetical protein n=1 Tax=Thiococcus pfennigii TaxID=1057 RepID=UPI001906B76A|nr:hypothetical protein [Thiococcus pfennigii]MBK1700965.1 hypothetical protein [Thiococcus pfennigii]